MSRCFHGINAMILMPQIFDVIANENACYKRNELELQLFPLSTNTRTLISNENLIVLAHCND